MLDLPKLKKPRKPSQRRYREASNQALLYAEIALQASNSDQKWELAEQLHTAMKAIAEAYIAEHRK
jgi:hypothetical protein